MKHIDFTKKDLSVGDIIDLDKIPFEELQKINVDLRDIIRK